MSEITSELEEKISARREQKTLMAKELAATYARLFLGSDDGKRVLADLRTKFGVARLGFRPDARGRFDYIAAAIVDGERRVLSEIENALIIGSGHYFPINA